MKSLLTDVQVLAFAEYGRAVQLGVSVKAYRDMVELLGGDPDGIIMDRF